MNAREFRALADRCRDLERTAVRDEVRQQFHQWVEDLEAEAKAVENARDYNASSRDSR
jgi:HPt (histidine-containing phosphotransfer) domain-containing protein